MSTGSWVVVGILGGVVVIGGVIYFTSKSSSASSPSPQPATTPGPGMNAINAVQAPAPAAPSPCDQANRLAALARGSSNPGAELQSYQYWAGLCAQAGGTPNAFPA